MRRFTLTLVLVGAALIAVMVAPRSWVRPVEAEGVIAEVAVAAAPQAEGVRPAIPELTERPVVPEVPVVAEVPAIPEVPEVPEVPPDFWDGCPACGRG